MSITGDAAVSLRELTCSSVIGINGSCGVYISELELDASVIGIHVSLYSLQCIADLSAEWLMAAVAIQPLDSGGEFGWEAICEVLSPEAQSALLVGILLGCSVEIKALSAELAMGWYASCEYILDSQLFAEFGLWMTAAVNIPAPTTASWLLQDIVGTAAVTLKPMTCTGIVTREFSAFCAVNIEALVAKSKAAATLTAAAHLIMAGMTARSSFIVTIEQSTSMGMELGCSAYLDNGPPAEVELSYEELNP